MDVVTRILFEEDPVGIGMSLHPFGIDAADEYRLEAETIVPRIEGGLDVAAVTRLVWEEFVVWFGADTAGDVEVYERVARRVVAAVG